MTEIHLDQTFQKIPEPIKFVSIEDLNAFPLPKTLESLPPSVFQQFLDSKDLLQGYLKQLKAYQEKQQEIIDQLDDLDNILGNVIHKQLIKDYTALVDKINQQIKSINIIYQEFLNLETYQYQLLSNNFNQDILKLKFKKLLEKTNQESLNIVKDYHETAESTEDDLNNMFENFKESRKLYHSRKEKLYRWEEERVSGFV
ncbi:conserved hypothetical protein [Candida dubliniensis CD36]|uniref:VPS37 C-terminal domain-containing protein n=1 Tax=Candida dubliniensis (strain CD36 / ATCC MYA-646 / CBS 7987 / NCPF 3949 / NRRL Y-17841) TaxID=573826 RepID=B9WDV0_CANDC|nr:conserved hypothetical protein [Candida dubliniensis CD36]CAX42857.1 conserved hypothetical protein [Candida dubliniensis CD36]